MLSRVSRKTPGLFARSITTEAFSDIARPRRSFLYVPSSSDRMLEKSLHTTSDTIIYDLEDSVSPLSKVEARERLTAFLRRPDIDPGRIAVRINDLSTPYFAQDLVQIAATRVVRTIILPKIHSYSDMEHISRRLFFADTSAAGPIQLIPSIESARGLWNVGEIASWKPKITPDHSISALLFAAEDYCADTSIIRTPSRRELLYTRSKIVNAAKAFKLEAIDMVCVNFHDDAYLKEECQDGRELGFTGKQAIHPNQVDVIQSTFVPTHQEIERAARIVHQMKLAHASDKGAFGLELKGGGREMIDAPMVKQATHIIALAQVAGLDIPAIQ